MADTVEIGVEPAAVTLAAGDTAELTAKIRNTGQTIDQLTVGIDGLDSAWYTLPVSSVALFPNDQDELNIVLHPPKEAEKTPGSYPFRVVITSQENPEAKTAVEAVLEIGESLGLELHITPERNTGRRAMYQVAVTNLSKREVTAYLEACDARNRLRYRFDNDRMAVGAGATATTGLEVRPGPLAYFGGEKEFAFEAGAVPLGEDGGPRPGYCPYCGHLLRTRPQGINISLPRYSDKVQAAYEGFEAFLYTRLNKTRIGEEGTSIYCPVCCSQLREDAATDQAAFVCTAWTASVREGLRREPGGRRRIRLSLRPLRRLRSIRFRCPRIRRPSLSRQPIIDSFSAASQDQREYRIAWSVRRAREVKLGDDVVAAEGHVIVRPTAPMTLALTAVNKRKSASRTVEVRPRALPETASSERIKASLSATEVEATAGIMPVDITLAVQNVGEIVDKFMVEVDGVDETWCIRSASSIALMPQASDQVRLSFQPPKKEGVLDGEYPFAVTVRSQTSPEEATTLLGKLTVLPQPEFKIEIKPMRVSGRRKGTFRVGVVNTGVSDVQCSLQASDLEEGCRFVFQREDTKVRAWQTVEVPMVARPKRNWFVGIEKRYDITVTATPLEGQAQLGHCELQNKPLFSSWRAILRLIRRAILIAAIAMFIWYAIHAVHWAGGWDQLTSDPGGWWRNLRGIGFWFP